MHTLYRDIKTALTQDGMQKGEARAIALLMLEKVAGLTTAEALAGDPRGEAHRTDLLTLAARIAQGEPVQYVLGEADFCGLQLKVTPAVLIPRKETEELVEWAVEELDALEKLDVQERLDIQEEADSPEAPSPPHALLDIGTGSGCIAIALARRLPHATVEAWDISPDAIAIAAGNADRHGVSIAFHQVDVLQPDAALPTSPPLPRFDLIVSNPPYICEEEAHEMEPNVLEHEPHTALFVPDTDPLRFYRRIAGIGLQRLQPGGRLLFEVNRRFGRDVAALLEEMGYRKVELRRDHWGNNRMVRAIKP